MSAGCIKEWTIECNPRSLTPEKLSLLAKDGINRVSLGAQSFEDSALQWLGRRHSVADIHDAVQMIKSAGFDNFGLDLIACIPGFKPDVWLKTLSAAIALAPKHISIYALTREEGSRLAREIGEKSIGIKSTTINPLVGRDSLVPPCLNRSDCRTGSPALPVKAISSRYKTGSTNSASHHQINLLSEDEEIDALDLAEKILTREGYKRYEISNYARPGYECLHNLDCWRGREYIGLGPAAASHVGLKRWTNLPDLGKYLQAVEQGKRPPRSADALNARLKKLEMIVFGLRLAEGISEATGKIRAQRLRELCEEGLVTNINGRWRLTKRGFYLADYVGRELLAGRNAE